MVSCFVDFETKPQASTLEFHSWKCFVLENDVLKFTGVGEIGQ